MSLLHKGPKLSDTPSSIPLVNYITDTKHICESLCENNLIRKTKHKEYYVKVGDALLRYVAKPKLIHPNITKEERKTNQDLRKDDSSMVITVDKGIALVIMHKGICVKKCMVLLNDKKSTKNAETTPSLSTL